MNNRPSIKIRLIKPDATFPYGVISCTLEVAEMLTMATYSPGSSLVPRMAQEALVDLAEIKAELRKGIREIEAMERLLAPPMEAAS